MPEFSVVIPLYNKADTIERAVRSVAAQSCRDWELLVVNDGSTDDSLSAVQRLSKEIPMRIIDKINGGVSSARNAGVAAAKGKFIALLDGDDIWYPEHLGRMKKAIAKYPEIKFFGGGYERLYGKYVYFTIPWGGYRVKDVYSTFRYSQPINSSTVVIEKDLWLEIGGFDDKYSFYEDYEFFFRLGLHTKCCVVQKVSGRYNDDAGEQATKRYREFSRENFPHLAFVDDMIKQSSASKSMILCAETQLGLLVLGAYLANAHSRVELLVNSFPNIVQRTCIGWILKSPFARLRMVLAVTFIVKYKIWCHFVMWRSHE